MTHHQPGKISTNITKPTETQKDLSLAYTPGVAEPVKAIRYTANPDPEIKPELALAARDELMKIAMELTIAQLY